jgi:hypothetical protein
MSFPHLGGVLKLGFTSSFVPISIGFRGIPIHLLMGHFNGPSSSIRSRKKILAQQRRPS